MSGAYPTSAGFRLRMVRREGNTGVYTFTVYITATHVRVVLSGQFDLPLGSAECAIRRARVTTHQLAVGNLRLVISEDESRQLNRAIERLLDPSQES